MALPGFKAPEGEPDLMVLGEIVVKHYLFCRGRPEKKVFIDEVTKYFYQAPATRFHDSYNDFNNVIQGNSTIYNDALLFVMAVVADLITPADYFKKLLKEFKVVSGNMPSGQLFAHNLTENDYFGCVFFAVRFFVDQLDLLAPGAVVPVQPEPEGDKK